MLHRLRKALERQAISQTARYLESHGALLCKEWLKLLEKQNPRYGQFEESESPEGAGLRNLGLLIKYMRAVTPEEAAELKSVARQMGQEKARVRLSQGFALEELLFSISLFRSVAQNGVKRMLASRLWLAPPWDVLTAESRIDEAIDIQMAAMSEAYLEAMDEVISRREEELRATNQQLLTLNQEMQHRIRNNLQTVADLFSLELARGISKPYEEHLRECVVRLKSIAAVHEILSTDNVVDTDIKRLAEQVASIAVRSMAHSRCRITVDVKGDSITLRSKKATSFALVLNELISNALEHAFKDRERGSITIDLRSHDSGVVAAIQDDGVGLPPGFDLESRAQTGLHVALALTRSDLGGTLSLENEAGAKATVRFEK